MAFDEQLGRSIRRLVDQIDELGVVEERRMFGGLAFLVDGYLAFVASGAGGIMARVHPDDVDELLASTLARPATMGARTMRGWLRLAGAAGMSDDVLDEWVRRGVGFASSLPPKTDRV